MYPFSKIRVGGYVMVLDFSDNASFKYYVDRDRYEYAEVTAFLKGIAMNPGSYIIDVGANFGAFTLAACSTFGKLGLYKRLFALEPDPRVFRALSKSVKRNEFSLFAYPMRYVASDRTGQEIFFENSRSSADNRSHRVTTAPIPLRREYAVPAITLDDLLAREDVPSDSKLILKMDIQGNEYRALRGMGKSLSSAKGYLLFFEHAPYLIESAGLNLDDYHSFLRGLRADSMFQITRTGLAKLDDFDAFLRSVRCSEANYDKRAQGAGGNYVFCKNMRI